MGFMRFSMRVLFYFALEFGAPEDMVDLARERQNKAKRLKISN